MQSWETSGLEGRGSSRESRGLVNGRVPPEAGKWLPAVPSSDGANGDAEKPFNYWRGGLDDRVVVNSGDVLLAWSGTPGTSFGTHIWERGLAVLNQHIFRVSPKQIEAIEIPAPPLAEQRAIAARLDAEFSATTALRAAVATKLAEVEKLPAALLRAAFGGPA